MSLVLYVHPHSDMCWATLVALYEKRIPFEKRVPEFDTLPQGLSRSHALQLLPALKNSGEEIDVMSARSVIEHLDRRFPETVSMIPTESDYETDASLALWDFFLWNVSQPTALLRRARLHPIEPLDPYAMGRCSGHLRFAYDRLDEAMASKEWAWRGRFSAADCIAAATLYQANQVLPVTSARLNLTAYLDRLWSRPSVARVIEEEAHYLDLPEWDPSSPPLPRLLEMSNFDWQIYAAGRGWLWPDDSEDGPKRWGYSKAGRRDVRALPTA